MESQFIKYVYDYLNPQKADNPQGNYVPGFRGENQMCIYTDTYSLKTEENKTGTNPWGLEAAVDENGIVIEINDRCQIPNKGFVISGNSKAHQFIAQNIKLGAQVTLDTTNHCIEIEVNKIKTGLYTLEVKLKQLKQRYQTACDYFYLFAQEKVAELLKNAEEIYFNCQTFNDLELFEENYQQFMKLYQKIYYMTTKVSKIRSAGLWSRPNEKTLEEITRFLDTMQKNHFNTLYLESFYNGGVAGKSSITNTVEHAVGDYGMYGDDYLKAVIAEAHKRNIEVHAWVENFFVGEDIKYDKDYPDYFRMVNYDGSTIQGPGGYNTEVPENGFIFLDPAHPETHQYILSIYEEMLSKYDFDGLNIDYIRYPHGNYDLATSNGYSQYAMNEFKKIYHFPQEADVRKLVEDEKNLKLWTEYRCGKITLLMKEIRELVDRVKPNCLISMAVVPETEYAILNKMQDWVLWVKNGWIDITLPMAYYFGSSEVAAATQNLVAFNQNKAFSYTGISPSFSGGFNFNAHLQIEAVYQNFAQGFAIFQLDNLLKTTPENQKTLQEGVLRIETVQPHASLEKVLQAFLEEYNLKYPRMIQCNNALKENADLFSKHLTDLIKQYNKTKDIILLYQNLVHLYHNLDKYFVANALETIKDDLKYLLSIIQIQSRKM